MKSYNLNPHTHIRNIRDLTREPANGPITITYLPESERVPKVLNAPRKNPHYQYKLKGGNDAS